MSVSQQQIMGVADDEPSDSHNVTDWCLNQFRSAYENPAISKDDIWEYAYGVMHAPDWRERYRDNLRLSLPRIPFAADFEAFRAAGRELIDLHVGFQDCSQDYSIRCLVRRDLKHGEWLEVIETDPESGSAIVAPYGQTQLSAYDEATERLSVQLLRIDNKMRLAKDETSLEISSRCKLVNIPPDAAKYRVSGRSPLRWAVDSLRHKHDNKTGIRQDPNGWEAWADDPFELIRHLRRLAWLSVRTVEIVEGLPSSLDSKYSPDALAQGVTL